jgi:hypothetical protein
MVGRRALLTWLDERDLDVLPCLGGMGDEPVRDQTLHRPLHHHLWKPKISADRLDKLVADPATTAPSDIIRGTQEASKGKW